MEGQPRLETLPEDWNKALAVAAHPDDLEYGTASAIARWTSQGKEVVYLLVTRGEAGIDGMTPEEVGPLREEEERRSASVVGVKTVEFLDHRDGTVEYGPPLRRDIARAIRKHRPEVLIILNHHLSWGGLSFNFADHRWVGLAALDPAQDAGNRWIFPELLAEGLGPWNGVKMVCVSASPYPTHAVGVTASFPKGVESLLEHDVYIKNLSGDFDADGFLRPLAEGTGKRFGTDLAVSFQVFML